LTWLSGLPLFKPSKAMICCDSSYESSHTA
jgi:hypothetical protein